MLHFEVGICASTLEELNKIFELIHNAYPEAKAIKTKNYCTIDLPMVHIDFLLIGQAIGHRFDKIYYSDNVSQQEINEILLPMTWAAKSYNLQPISYLYKQFTN